MRNLSLILAAFCFTLIQIVSTDWNCPYGWTKTSYGCKSSARYDRGAGYPWKFGDDLNLKAARKRCEKAHPELGCQKTDQVIYPKCRDGFSHSYCCTCEWVNYNIEGFKKHGSEPSTMFDDVFIEPI